MAKVKKEPSLIEDLQNGNITDLDKIGLLEVLQPWAGEHLDFPPLAFKDLSGKDTPENVVSDNISIMYKWAKERTSFNVINGINDYSHEAESDNAKLSEIIKFANENTSFTQKIN